MSIRAVCVFVTNIRKRECAILGSDTRDESLSGIEILGGRNQLTGISFRKLSFTILENTEIYVALLAGWSLINNCSLE